MSVFPSPEEEGPALGFPGVSDGAVTRLQVDLATASIRPGRPATWLARLRERLVAAVRASRGELTVMVGTWEHDLAQANLLPAAEKSRGKQLGGAGMDVLGAEGGWRGRLRGRGGGMSTLQSWREGDGTSTGEEAVQEATHAVGRATSRAPLGPTAQRQLLAWEQRVDLGLPSPGGREESVDWRVGSNDGDPCSTTGGVSVKVFPVDGHRLAAALDSCGQLVPLVRDAVLHQLGLRSTSVRVANLL